jgi:hypothetical protein
MTRDDRVFSDPAADTMEVIEPEVLLSRIKSSAHVEDIHKVAALANVRREFDDGATSQRAHSRNRAVGVIAQQDIRSMASVRGVFSSVWSADGRALQIEPTRSRPYRCFELERVSL